MQPLFVLADADRRVEKGAESRCGEKFGARTVSNDPAIPHKDHAVNFRENVAQVMGHQHKTCTLGYEAAQGVAEFALRGEIESIRGLIEEQLARSVHERAGNQDAAFLAGGHLSHKLRGKMRGFDARESFCGPGTHFFCNHEIGPECRSGKEAGDHGIETRSHRRALAGKIGAHDAEMLPQLGQVPAITAKDAHPHLRLNNRVDLTGNGEDQRGLAAPVGAQDCDMLAGAKGEVHVVEHDPIAARNVHVLQFEELVGIDGGWNIICVL